MGGHPGAPLELGHDGDRLRTVTLRAQVNVRIQRERAQYAVRGQHLIGVHRVVPLFPPVA